MAGLARMFDGTLSMILAQVEPPVFTNAQTVFMVLAALLITGFLVLWLRSRSKMKTELAEKEALILQLREKLQFDTERHDLLKSEMHHASERLNHLGEFKSALDHLIGHDLKNALNSILGLSRNKDDKTIQAVQACGQLALSMLGNMLDVQRFEEKQVHLRMRHHCIKETLFEAKAQVQFFFLAKHLSLKIDIPDGVLVLIDKEMLSRALVNLLVNAVKYSKVGTTVHVRVRNVVGSNGDALTEISVKDEGEGIAPEKLPHIFDRYWLDEGKDMGRQASAGLGLLFCKHVLESHGGSIAAESEPGQGTRFVMQLPYVEAVVEECSTGEPLSIVRDEVSISNDQLTLIREHGQRLYELKVYEITKIKEVIEELSQLNIKTTWTGELQMAVYQGDQQKYDELVGMIQ